MKLKEILLVIVVALIPQSVIAAEGQTISQYKFNRLDTNHDGVISRDEAKADATLSQEWSKADTNKDGKIEESEFSAFEEEMEPGGVPKSGNKDME